jgi:Tfp pilus assembly protein PilO
MSTPVPFSMFVIGAIVFVLYLTGYVYMILKASEQQQNEFKKDTELQSYYKSQKKNRKE